MRSVFANFNVKSFLLFTIFFGSSFGNVVFKDDGLSQTVPIQIPKKGIIHLKSQILQILGLSEEPRNATKDEFASKFMSELYQLENEFEEHGMTNVSSTVREFLLNADTIISFTPSKKHDIDELNISELDFSQNDLPVGSRLINAELRLQLNNTDLLLDTVAAYFRPDEGDNLVPLENLEMFASENDDSQLALNITSIVEQWLHNSSMPRSIFLQLQKSNGSISSLSGNGDWHGFGVASFEDPKNLTFSNSIRSKREISVPYDEEEELDYETKSLVSERPNPFRANQNYKNCRLHRLYVSFAELGWDQFVIAPSGFDAQYCDGFCDIAVHSRMNASNHAIVQTLIHFIDASRTEKAKCAPTEMKQMKILFFDNTNNAFCESTGTSSSRTADASEYCPFNRKV
ncbi:hypothetical protein L596_011192 [Steinernema carpocapsae]|uniref:TGF-beta family profile domain-containing protein n=1 Tax=Steinernema carpocapsae TaxID=34508 RepID=A0A4U5NTM0_STECR|nr:hypothetical protein L596_011192 [Steinernema carpocapsae]